LSDNEGVGDWVFEKFAPSFQALDK